MPALIVTAVAVAFAAAAVTLLVGLHLRRQVTTGGTAAMTAVKRVRQAASGLTDEIALLQAEADARSSRGGAA